MKNTLDGINNRLEEVAEWVSNLEDRVVEINQAEQVREKKNENDLGELSDSIKCNKIHIIGIPEEKKKEKKWQKNY